MSDIKPITKESAIHIAKHVVLHEAELPTTPMLKKIALRSAANGESLNEIFDKLYGLGFVVSGDTRHPYVANLFKTGALIEKK